MASCHVPEYSARRCFGAISASVQAVLMSGSFSAWLSMPCSNEDGLSLLAGVQLLVTLKKT